MDAVFKLNTSEYSVFIVGVSNSTRHFHPIVMFITSQRNIMQYVKHCKKLMKFFWSANRKYAFHGRRRRCPLQRIWQRYQARRHVILDVLFHVLDNNDSAVSVSTAS
ncbi:hypothetical protein PHMEG_00026999 [Phytophthora megakarya]|uniref:Uncharacterized protein n=1 Tax=Phytophthora megakarya TaxID=4795 RepID=A0A225VAU9_9STRA|nr:hypothetical protein PHMEG_00026999 [Phytophthora megakarya]